MCRRNEQYNDSTSQSDAPGRKEIIKKGKYKYEGNSALVRENYAKLARLPSRALFSVMALREVSLQTVRLISLTC